MKIFIYTAGVVLLLYSCKKHQDARTLQVNAGGDKEMTLPANEITLFAESSAANNTTVYSWRIIAGPAIGSINKISPAANFVKLSNLVEGIYQLEVTATDFGQTAKDTVMVSVYPDPGKDSVVFYDISSQPSFMGGYELTTPSIRTAVPSDARYRVYIMAPASANWEYRRAFETAGGQLMVSASAAGTYNVMVKWN